MRKERERRAVLRAPVLAGATHTELVARLAVMGDARSMAGVGASAKACAVEMRARLSPNNDTAPIAMFSSRHKMGFFYFELALLKTLLEVRGFAGRESAAAHAILRSRSFTQAGPWIIATQPARNALPRRDLGF